MIGVRLTAALLWGEFEDGKELERYRAGVSLTGICTIDHIIHLHGLNDTSVSRRPGSPRRSPHPTL